MEAVVASVVLALSMIGAADGAWCVCRQDVSDSALQKTIDYACGAGADCSPINQNGACYNPNTVKSHCSYAVNSYYLRKGGQAPQACDFAGTAALTQQDPSSNGCTFPASSSAAGTSTGNNNGAGIGAGSGASPVTGSGAGTSTGTGTGTGIGTGTGTGAFPTPFGINPGSATPSTMNPSSSGTGGVMGGLGPSGNVISTDGSSHSLISTPQLISFLLLILSVLVMLRA